VTCLYAEHVAECDNLDALSKWESESP